MLVTVRSLISNPQSLPPKFLALLTAMFMGSVAYAQTGQVIDASQPVRVFVGQEGEPLDVGDTVEVGDIIVTGTTGEAQIIFPDETKIVVGPNSQLKIDRLLFRDNSNTARRFAVSAAKGTFRFISGNSPRRAYSVRTPIATMGLRGTAFDFAVEERRATDLVVYDGLVNFCLRGRGCARVPSGCTAVQILGARFLQPGTSGERLALLLERFPYAIDQESLEREFRTFTRECEQDNDQPNRVLERVQLPAREILREENERPEAVESNPNPAE